MLWQHFDAGVVTGQLSSGGWINVCVRAFWFGCGLTRPSPMCGSSAGFQWPWAAAWHRATAPLSAAANGCHGHTAAPWGDASSGRLVLARVHPEEEAAEGCGASQQKPCEVTLHFNTSGMKGGGHFVKVINSLNPSVLSWCVLMALVLVTIQAGAVSTTFAEDSPHPKPVSVCRGASLQHRVTSMHFTPSQRTGRTPCSGPSWPLWHWRSW